MLVSSYKTHDLTSLLLQTENIFLEFRVNLYYNLPKWKVKATPKDSLSEWVFDNAGI